MTQNHQLINQSDAVLGFSVANVSGGAMKFSCLLSFRVTGKMVGTASHESVQAGTKLLDIPLSPENNMTAL